ncbi:unnamed protein product [Nesidiocoris tenuis]|uniref:DUF7041 domain-containing protein n=1 Tax=Nesidiocoris tenuis TaxID=355587 RepID=A0A6H5GVB3_9HEMI|nr:unnamed protein product [Nesidiocoris tenuis]
MANDSSKKSEAADAESSVQLQAIKIGPIWRKQVKTWFVQIEAQFYNGRCNSEISRYNHLVANLESDVAEMVSDFFDKPRSDTPYSDLKARIISEFEVSEGRKVKKLLSEIELGDRKPSSLLREMRQLAGLQIKDDFLKTMFIQRLPSNVSSILASSNDDLDSLAGMADKIIEYSSSSSVFSARGNPPCCEHNQPVDTRLSRLEASVAELVSSIGQLASRFPRARSRSRSRSVSRRHASPVGGWCWYHAEYRDKAQRCVSPCSYASKKKFSHQSSSGN